MIRILLHTILLLFSVVSVYGQEVVELGSWSSSYKRDLGNGQYVWGKYIARPFKVLKKGNKILNISRNDTITYEIKDIQNYSGKVVKGDWQDNFDITSDSFICEIDSSLEIENVPTKVVEIFGKKDTIKKHIRIKKKGRLLMRMLDVKGFDIDNNIVNVDTIKVKGNKIIHKFKSKVKTVDPTWSWQPDETDGIDAYTHYQNPNSNYNNTALVAGGDYHALILFQGWKDSIAANSIIDSAFFYGYEDGSSGTRQVYISRIPGESGGYWTETGVTHNTLPDSASPYSADTLTAANDGSWWKFDITDIIDTIYTNDLVDSGMMFIGINPYSPANYMKIVSSAGATASERPKIEIYYHAAPVSSQDPRVIVPIYDGRHIPLYDNKKTPIYNP